MLRWLIRFFWFQLGQSFAVMAQQRARGRRHLVTLGLRIPASLYLCGVAVWKAWRGPFPAGAGAAPKATVVLLSWGRAPNMNLLAMLSARAPFIERVVISNNNPAVAVSRLVPFKSPKIVLIDQPRETKQGIRFPLALQYPGDWFIFIDDDVFLTPHQLTLLYRELLEHPDVPHGYKGSCVLDVGDTSEFFKRGDWDRPVQFIYGVYLCSREVLERYMRLAHALGITRHEQFGNGEDLILSCSGRGFPMIHPTGHVVSCATWALVGISTSNTLPQFREERKQLTRRLWELRPEISPMDPAAYRVDFLEPRPSLRIR